MDNIKVLLQKILKSDSNSMNQLFEDFKNNFPEELGIIQLLMNYIYSENKIEDTSILEKALKSLI